MTLGKKFIKKFINLRKQHAVHVVEEIEKWLTQNKIPFKTTAAETGSLLDQFFSYKDDCHTAFILHTYPEMIDNTVIIGKGVCFDTGGYDLKNDMKDMFYDKNGAILSLGASIDQKTPAIVFFVSNFINNDVVPGQIMTDTYTKLRILIDDTDAEGRIGLAHCLGYAKSLGYTKALTLATLTGAAHNFSGDRTYALVHSTDHNDLIEITREVITRKFEKSNEINLWPAPYHEKYDKSIDSKIKGADIGSCGTFRGAGSSTAFSFLKRFSTGMHHIHVDMAAMSTDKNKNGLVWGLREVEFLTSFFA